ncbi:MAG TPA: hypothetical protein VNR64_08965 [Vicinamibacterales bacterium]|nr:hypothetical protein [Vicinamibacterales bacterium]
MNDTTHDTDSAAGNLRMIGKILAVSAIVLTLFAIAAGLGFFPVSVPAARAAAIVFAVTAGVEFITAFFFLQRYKG